ncbi:MarR family winged helix-turn-helix transcriptional regulator [uncultured Devosia sp.]|uniref:MarR family winged helix-turn-helix transcriptional regulator n=1 Tax=uncultured Devosia sp. TaxID=211434 RepID=UPI0035C95156
MTDFAELLRIFTADMVVAGRMWRKLAREAVARHGVAEAGAAPLLWIGRLGGKVRQNVLADYCGMEGASLVRILDDLEAAGLVVRVPDASDRRANLLDLTDEGQSRLREIEADLAAFRLRTFEDIGPGDIEAALRVFGAIKAAAERDGQGGNDA